MINQMPNGWKLEKLGKLANITMGQSPPSSTYNKQGEGLPFFQGKAEFGEIFPTIVKYCSNPLRIAEPSDILISVRAPVGPVNLSPAKCCIGRGLCSLRSKKDKLDQIYLFFYLRSIEANLSRQGQGSTFKAIGRKDIEDIEIPHPVRLQTQRLLASVLERAEILRQKREQANQLTGSIVKSVFIKMFGDPFTNPKKWSIAPFIKFAAIERHGILPKDIVYGTKYVGLEHIEKDTGNILGVAEAKKGSVKSNKFKFTSNHILYGKLRPYLNKVALPDFSGICSTDILPILPKEGTATKHFVAFLMRHSYFARYATEKSTGANLPRISPEDIERFEAPLPPFTLQQQFSEFLRGIQNVLSKQIQSEREINQLFQALMYKAFRGELNINSKEVTTKPSIPSNTQRNETVTLDQFVTDTM